MFVLEVLRFMCVSVRRYVFRLPDRFFRDSTGHHSGSTVNCTPCLATPGLAQFDRFLYYFAAELKPPAHLKHCHRVHHGI